jgi:hypothetical protein
MIARKDSPVWAAISRFGNPIPPYDFNSGMDVLEINRDEAIALGVMTEDEQVQPQQELLTENLQAGAAGITEDVYGAMRDVFNAGGEVQIDKRPDGRIVWNRERATPESRDDLQHDYRDKAGSLFSRSLGAFAQERSGDGRTSLDEASQRGIQEAWAAQSTAAALGRKPLFHDSLGDQAERVAARLREAYRDLPTVEVRAEDGNLFVWDRNRNPKDFSKIRERGNSGRELGYGVEHLGDADVAKVFVSVLNTDNQPVAGFFAPLEFGGIFGAARAKDFRDATGQPHTYTLQRRARR